MQRNGIPPEAAHQQAHPGEGLDPPPLRAVHTRSSVKSSVQPEVSIIYEKSRRSRADQRCRYFFLPGYLTMFVFFALALTGGLS